MPSHIFFDSDDERDNFDIERREIGYFQREFLSASFESSEDDEEGIIDGTKIPSSTKVKSRARHSYLDISTLSSPSLSEQEQEQENPLEIISKSIDIENSKPIKKKKSLGLSKSKIQLDTHDIYEQEDSNHSRHSSTSKTDETPSKEEKKTKVRKPTRAAVLETERKMQQLSRSEQLVLPTFVPKPLESWHALEKRSRQELMNEIRAQNPSFTPQDPELPELPVVNIESTVESTLADLTKLIEDKPSKSTDKLNKLSRFLNPDILKKKPVMKELNTIIDLTDTKKPSNQPTLKTNINISLDCIKSPSSSKKLFEMQKQLGIRMRAKRAAMLAENSTNLTNKDDEDNDNDDVKEVEDDSSDSSDDNQESEIDKENEDLQVDDEETKQISSDEDLIEENENEEEEEEEETEEQENATPSSDTKRPSLKTVLNRLESSSDSVQIQPKEQDGRTEWFNSARPAQVDSELEMLCSGAFDGDNIIPVSQNYKHAEPIAFSPLPTTQIDEEQEQPDIEIRRAKVRQLIDDDDEDQSGSNEQANSGSNNIEESEDEEEEGVEENEELIDYKKQLFEMEAEESGSEIDEKEKEKDNDESDSDEEPDEELKEFIDTAAVEVDDEEADNMAKVFLKIKAKEDEHQLKLLKEQYLDFEGDEDGRRIKLLQARNDDDDDDEDDPDYNSEIAEEEEDDEEDDEPIDLKDRLSELERQRSIQDNQAEELHLDEDLDNIGQHSSMFQKGLALKQKKLQSTITTTHIESTSQITNDNTTKKPNQTRSVTLSSVLLAKRFSSTLLAPLNRNNLTVTTTNNTEETTITTKKQHNPRRHVFATYIAPTNSNENQNPSTSSGEKRSNSSDKSPKTNIKRFKQSTTTSITTVPPKTNESSTSVFSALGFSNTRL